MSLLVLTFIWEFWNIKFYREESTYRKNIKSDERHQTYYRVYFAVYLGHYSHFFADVLWLPTVSCPLVVIIDRLRSCIPVCNGCWWLLIYFNGCRNQLLDVLHSIVAFFWCTASKLNIMRIWRIKFSINWLYLSKSIFSVFEISQPLHMIQV